MNKQQQWVVIDSDGDPWGPFESKPLAFLWAAKKWPDEQHDEERRHDG